MTTDDLCGCEHEHGCCGPAEVHVHTASAPTPQKARVPKGGTAGQVLTKRSDADGDTEWTTPVTPEDVETAVAGGVATVMETVGQALLGPAEDMDKLKPGGVLFITDGRDPITEELEELQALLEETNQALDEVLDGDQEQGGEDSGQDQGGEQGGDPGEAQAAESGV